MPVCIYEDQINAHNFKYLMVISVRGEVKPLLAHILFYKKDILMKVVIITSEIRFFIYSNVSHLVLRVNPLLATKHVTSVPRIVQIVYPLSLIHI